MNNLEIYDKVRAVPENAQKKIEGGKLKGKTDINPMWRIKTLTEVYGPCGIGWTYVIKNERLEPSKGGEIAAFVSIDLYVKDNGEWSKPIPGTGGSMFVATEKGQLVTNDECFKMALTDAISVACKALGFAADVYWEKDRTKYDGYGTNEPDPEPAPKGTKGKGKQQNKEDLKCQSCGKPFVDQNVNGTIVSAEYQFMNAIQKRGGAFCKECHNKMKG